MNVRQYIVSQFRQPRGMLGHVAGLVMANRPSNIARNQWTLELLKLQSNDRLLEIGFGPGIAIQNAPAIVTDGLIVGVDHSAVMLRQASKRNAKAIAGKQVQLYSGSLDNLPQFEAPFSKIYSVNVVQFWQDPVSMFVRLRARLDQNGLLVSTYMPRNKHATAADAEEMALEIVNHLRSAGFIRIEVERLSLQPVPAISVIAIND